MLEQRAAQAAKKYHPYLEYTSRLDTYIHTSKRIKIQHQKKNHYYLEVVVDRQKWVDRKI